MKEAAELGLPEAMHNLGDLYKKRNEPLKSIAWFLAAAKSFFYPSMINIAVIFLNGEGPVVSNPYVAMIWLKKAREMQDSPELVALAKQASDAIKSL